MTDCAPKKNKIHISDYQENWPQIYEDEAAKIKSTLSKNCLAIHHIGSTAVPKLKAKPKIDIMAVVENFSDIDIAAIEALGFAYKGEVIPTGRYFSKSLPVKVHLHLFEKGNPLIADNLIFRDWLRTHKSDRQAYENLKLKLASRYKKGEVMGYCHAKTDFIQSIIAKAKKLESDIK